MHPERRMLQRGDILKLTSTGKAAGYSATQIALHWVVAGLVLFQLLFGESMGAVRRATRRGLEPDPSDVWLSDMHYWVGLSIILLVLIRIAARWRFGVPAAMREDWTARAASALHALFYVLLVATPMTGLLACYYPSLLGELHELSKPVFIVLITLHAAAALWHQFVDRDGTLARMLPAAWTKGNRP